MSILSTVGVMSVIAFGGVSDSMTQNFNAYVEKSHTPDGFVTTGFVEMTDELKAEIEGIESLDGYTFNAMLPAATYIVDKNESKSSQLFTFERDQLYVPTIVSEITYSDTLPNVFLENNFATENDIKNGSIIELGYEEQSLQAHVVGRISFPDTLKYGASKDTAANNKNFGRIYMEKSQMLPVISELIDMLKDEADIDISELVGDMEKLKQALAEGTQTFGNYFHLYTKDGYDSNETVRDLTKILENNEYQVMDHYTFKETAIYSYVFTNVDSFGAIGKIVGLAIFGIMILIITLFLNQILKGMMHDIGIFNAVGFKREDVMLLLAGFTFIISVIGSILGIISGNLLGNSIDNLASSIFKYPLTVTQWRPIPTLIGVGATLLVSQIATFFSVFTILKLTPVQALSENPSDKVKMTDRLDKVLKKAPPTTKLAINSITRKPKKYITSFVAILASLFLIFMAFTFRTSYQVALDQTFKKCLNYETQIVLVSGDEDFEDELTNLGVTDIEKCEYARITIEYKGKTFDTVLQGLELDSNKITIPKKFYDSNPLPEDGIVVNKNIAMNLNIKANDTIKVDGHDVKVAYISNFETYAVCLCNIAKIKEYAKTTYPSYFVSGADKETIIHYMSNYHYDSSVSFKEDTMAYFSNNFAPMQSVTLIFVAISMMLGALIVILMNQTALTEQKRDISVLRSIGFSVNGISNLWSVQSISQFIFASLIGIPLSVLATKFLMKFVATAISCVGAYISWLNILLTLVCVAAFMIVSHSACMLIVKKWNIADNTKNRES